MLEMKEICETCNTPLGHEDEALICSYECTFCPPCNEITHKGTCPNCGGELVARPKREIKDD